MAGPILGLILLCGFASSALAAVDGRDFIGPHEYDLPLDFGTINFFVQYVDIDSSDQQFNSDGDTVGRDNIDTVVGFSKYVRAWEPSWAPIGLGYEVVPLETGIRNTTANSSSSGFADPITGPFYWFKPTPNSTIGQDFLIQVPVGDSDVGGGQVWNFISSIFYDIHSNKFDLTGDVGVITPLSDSTATNSRPGTNFFTDHVLTYQLLSWVGPFVGTTYENVGSTTDRVNDVRITSGHELLVSGGLYFPFKKGQSFSVRYNRGIEGKSHARTNELSVRYILAF